MITCALSPYHLTTREAPALAACLLAERVVTMIPAPFDGTQREHVGRAAAQVPRYLELMESWRWALPLFTAGLIVTDFNGEDIADDVAAACARIAGEDRYADLRPFMKEHLFDDQRQYLDAICRDLLRGGPDPALTVPVAAGIDAFAARHGLVVVRAEPASVVQRAEQDLARRRAAAVIPMLVQASAERLLEARTLLARELTPLRAALATGLGLGEPEGTGTIIGEAQTDADARLRDAARDYTDAFDACRDALLRPEDDDAPRVVEGMLSLAAVTLPADAVLASSLIAVRSLARPTSTRSDRRTSRSDFTDDNAASCAAVVVRTVGQRPAARPTRR